MRCVPFAADGEAAVGALFACLGEANAAEALQLGHGGINHIAALLGCSACTVRRGIRELHELPRLPIGSPRRQGAASVAWTRPPALKRTSWRAARLHCRRPEGRSGCLDQCYLRSSPSGGTTLTNGNTCVTALALAPVTLAAKGNALAVDQGVAFAARLAPVRRVRAGFLRDA
jgi:hypothetical protein